MPNGFSDTSRVVLNVPRITTRLGTPINSAKNERAKILDGLYIIAGYPEYLSLIARRCSQEMTTIVTIINTV